MGQQASTAVITALVLAGGIILGSTLFGDDGPSISPAPGEGALERLPSARHEAAEISREPVLLQSNSDLAHALERIAALEAEVRDLQERQAKDQAALKPLVEMYEQAKAGGMLQGGPEGAIPEGAVLVDDMGGGGPVNQLSGAMGLNGEREKAFQTQRAKILAAAAELEKRHAEVSVDGDTTTIKIGELGSDGEALRRRWDDWKRDNWTADELAAYRKGGGDNTAFGARLGTAARTIKIKEKGGSIRVSESSAVSDDESVANEIMGPAAARDLILQDYAHLLK